MRKAPSQSQKGFTLIEMLVSLSLFAVVMTISMGSLLMILDANRKSHALEQSTNNMFFSFETMTRLIRTGSYYYCGNDASGWEKDEINDCPTGQNKQIFFKDDMGNRVSFYLDKPSGKGVIMQQVGSSGTAYPITADDFDVTRLLFHVTDTALLSDTPPNKKQPTVTVTIIGIANKGQKTETELKLQTTLTQRIIDL